MAAFEADTEHGLASGFRNSRLGLGQDHWGRSRRGSSQGVVLRKWHQRYSLRASQLVDSQTRGANMGKTCGDLLTNRPAINDGLQHLFLTCTKSSTME